MGFIEETGAAQMLRDSRISSIYEGTNGIQAIDLVTRKLPLSDGEHVRGFIAELREIAERAAPRTGPNSARWARDCCRRSTIWKRRPSIC